MPVLVSLFVSLPQMVTGLDAADNSEPEALAEFVRHAKNRLASGSAKNRLAPQAHGNGN